MSNTVAPNTIAPNTIAPNTVAPNRGSPNRGTPNRRFKVQIFLDIHINSKLGHSKSVRFAIFSSRQRYPKKFARENPC